MNELLHLRQENSKSFHIHGTRNRGLLTSLGVLHYKDDYQDGREPWKDIDLTWDGVSLTKAPYILNRIGNKILLEDKRTREKASIELVQSPGVGFEIVPEFSRVNFRYTVDSLPFEAKFRVAGKIRSKAYDDAGDLEIDSSLEGDILTERLTRVIDKITKNERAAVGKIRIDPSWDARPTASADDCWVVRSSSLIETNSGTQGVGRFDGGQNGEGGGMRFLNVTIPQGVVITVAHLVLVARNSNSNTPVYSRIHGLDEDSDVNQFTTYLQFVGRTRTTATITWDNIAAWTAETTYTSPEFPAVIQEIVDRPGWASGNNMGIFWEDPDQRTTNNATTRQGKAYDLSTTECAQLYIEYRLGTIGSNPAEALVHSGLF